MALLTVDREKCTACGACAAVCPPGIIYFKEGNRPRQLPGTDEVCIRCGHCVAVCPTAAMDNAEAPLAATIPMNKEFGVPYGHLVQLVRGRRSIREFQDREVPREQIEKLIDVARYAPTGHNNQEVKWHVITGRETIKKLADIGLDWLRWSVEQNPAMEAMMGGVIKRQESGFDEFLRSAPAIVMACVAKENYQSGGDCAIALAYFDLLAGADGLGCCWGGFFNGSAASYPPMMEAVGVPEGLSPRGALMVGYPRYAYPRIPPRNPAEISWQPRA